MGMFDSVLQNNFLVFNNFKTKNLFDNTILHKYFSKQFAKY